MGHSHFWEPGEEWEVHYDHWQILIDTHVSLAVQETAMVIVHEFSEDQMSFFDSFIVAFHKVDELGYDNLVLVPSNVPLPTSNPYVTLLTSIPSVKPSPDASNGPSILLSLDPVTPTNGPSNSATSSTLAPVAESPTSTALSKDSISVNCQDNPSMFNFGTSISTTSLQRTCKRVYATKREKRCGKFNSSAEYPVSCSATDCIPFDTVGTFTFKGKKRSCWWVANKNPKTRCKKDILRSNCCPMTCNGNTYDF